MSNNPLSSSPRKPAWITALIFAISATSCIASPHLGDETLMPAGPYGTSGPGWGDAQFGNEFIQMEAHARFAGAIASLRYGGVEYINNDDHGRQMQMAVALRPGTECRMPTEAGSSADGSGPTSSSVLRTAQVGAATWQTSTSGAHWLASVCGEPIVADDLFSKQILVGIPGDAKVIRYTGQMQLVDDYQQIYAEIPTIYLRAPFVRHYRMDPHTGETWEHRPVRSYTHGSPTVEQEASNVPLIFATQDGNHAIGMWSPFESQGGDFQYRAHMFDFTPVFGNGTFNTSKLTATRSWGDPAGRRWVDNATYIAVGSLDSVRVSLKRLYGLEPTGVLRQWPDPSLRIGTALPPPTTGGPGIPVMSVSAFDQASPDVESGNRVKQVAITSDGKQLVQRYYDGGWRAWTNLLSVNAIGLGAVRSFSQGPDAENKPKQYFVNRAGDTIYSRTFINGAWGPVRTASVASLGIPGVSKIRSFDRTGPDAAIGNQLKDIVVSDDGRTQYFRKIDKVTQVPTGWFAGAINQIGIPGLETAKSLSQSVTPEGYPKFHLVSGDGQTIYTRVLVNGTWSGWNSVSVSALGMTE